MGRVTFGVEKQDPVVDSHEYPECQLTVGVQSGQGVGDLICFGDCGGIKTSGGVAQLQTVGEEVRVAPCGQSVLIKLLTD